MKYLKKFALVSFLIIISQVTGVRDLVVGSQIENPLTDSSETEHYESLLPEDDSIQAIIVVKSSSGKSYIADRDSIASMPALTSEAEVADFIRAYESSADNRATVREYFEQAGFKIVAQDNLFLIVSGSTDNFQILMPNYLQNVNGSSEKDTKIFSNNSISDINGLRGLIDGIIIPQESAEINELNEPSNDFTNINLPSVSGSAIQASYADYDDVLEALELDKVHQQGYLGKGVRVGFFDSGVYFGHPFFRDYPVNMKFYKFINGIITKRSNYDPNDSHGTKVASFLLNSAPQAEFYSFSKVTNSKTDGLLSYLVFINSSHLVDIFSLSQGVAEEMPGFSGYMADIRMEFINFINDNGLVFVAGGNAKQCSLWSFFYCSGHNWYAAFPEVIAVGGSDIQSKVASHYYLKAARDASSFSSIHYPGRNVPDVVSLFGPLKVPLLSGGFGSGSGTSFSTPQIAGMAALLKASMPNLSQYQVKEILVRSSLDITSGSNEDGDEAAVGYDRATGYGQPIATQVMKHQQQLYAGWNFIGATTTYDFTAESLLRYIQSFGSGCDILSVYNNDIQGYESIIIDDRGVFGSDFDIFPYEGIWVRCKEKTTWTSKGTYFDSAPSIPLVAGLNAITVAFSPYTCEAEDLLQETNGACTLVARYESNFDILVLKNGITHGANFPFIPGKGYFVKCTSKVTWTPSCSNTFVSSDIAKNTLVDNRFTVDAIRIQTNQTQIAAELMPQESTEAVGCTIPGRFWSNLTENSFSVIWTTDVPCQGSLLVNQGGGLAMIAADDRGFDYSGTSHQITVKGLSPQTSYNYQIISGTNIGDWQVITTGASIERVPLQKNTIYGTIFGINEVDSPSVVVYAWLVDGNGTRSSDLSVVVGQNTNEFNLVLGNARTSDLLNYFDLTSAKEIVLNFWAGSNGFQWMTIPVSLSTTQNDIDIGNVYLKPIPRVPEVQSPLSTTMNFRPSFTFSSNGASLLQYRLELSRDNFNTIEYAFDQNQSTTGWSSPNYSDGQTAQFTLPIELENMNTYYWRVFAYDVNNATWSGASKTASFSVVRYYQYLPAISS